MIRASDHLVAVAAAAAEIVVHANQTGFAMAVPKKCLVRVTFASAATNQKVMPKMRQPIMMVADRSVLMTGSAIIAQKKCSVRKTLASAAMNRKAMPKMRQLIMMVADRSAPVIGSAVHAV